MKKLTMLVPSLLLFNFVWAFNPFSIFPDEKIDFLILTDKTFLLCDGKRYSLEYYTLKARKDNFYTLSLHFSNRKPDKVEEFGFLKVKVYGHPQIINIRFNLWYRGQRFAFPYLGNKPLRAWDFSPKCRFVENKGSLKPSFEVKKEKIYINGCQLFLTITFTRCDL